jgi:hypothetical protein
VVDGRERVLWIPGVARSSLLLPGAEDDALMLSVSSSVAPRREEVSNNATDEVADLL